MLRRTYFLALSLLLGPVIGFAGETPDHSPAFTAVSELTAGFDLLYEQKLVEAREVFALGMANYIIGSLGPASRFTLWFGGIHGDKKLGMEQLAKTAENGLYLKPFAKIVLALAARREKQDALAQKLLRELTEQYPGNELFASEYAKASGMPLQVPPAR